MGLDRCLHDSLPARSEAETIVERIAGLRNRVTNLEAHIRSELKLLGAPAEDLSWLCLVDVFNDAAGSVEREAREAIDEANARDEAEHVRIESGLMMAKSGVRFGRG